MKKVTAYVDFDGTLYDTYRMVAVCVEIFTDVFRDREAVLYMRSVLQERHAYSFEAHAEGLGIHGSDRGDLLGRLNDVVSKGQSYLFPDAMESLTRLRSFANVVLITRGVASYQLRKVRGSGLIDFFDDMLFVEGSECVKGEFIRQHEQSVVKHVYFADDRSRELCEAKEAFPSIMLRRIMYSGHQVEPHPRDGRDWIVHASISDFVAELERIAS